MMLRVCLLSEMVPGASTDSIVLATRAIIDAEIEQRIWEVLGNRDVVFLVPGHPPMRLDEDFVPLVRD